jgi:lipopolysaccharide biosynthesis glycosyltransferase
VPDSDLSDPIHLVCAADAHYGAYSGIMLASVLRANPGEHFEIHLLSDHIRKRDRRKITTLVEAAGSCCTVYDVADRLMGYSRGAGNHLSRAAYARLLIADLLPASIEHVLYLDCDIICTGALRPLWQLAGSMGLLGMVPDREGEGWKALLGLQADTTYYNSGVLLIDLAAWRKNDVAGRLREWLSVNPKKIRLADQDAINACLQDRIAPLPDCWNLQIGLNSGPLPVDRLASAALLHYNGQHKPWEYHFRGQGFEIFRAEKRASSWRYSLPTFRVTYRLTKAINKRIARWRSLAGKYRHFKEVQLKPSTQRRGDAD